MMITDHSNINNQLKDPAQQNNVKRAAARLERPDKAVGEVIVNRGYN